MNTAAQLDYQDRAGSLYDAACTLMRHQDDVSCWHNLQNAAAWFDASRQLLRLHEARQESTPPTANDRKEGEQTYPGGGLESVPINQRPTPSVSASELLPCPHCGKQAYINRSHDPDNYMFLQCSGCNACMHRSLVEGEEAAVKNLTERWNQRSYLSSSASVEEIAREATIKAMGFEDLDLKEIILAAITAAIVPLEAELEQANEHSTKLEKSVWESGQQIAKLQAELEQAKELNKTVHSHLTTAGEAIADLQSLLATAEADTKRLDWLEDPLNQNRLFGYFLKGGSPQSVRRAIDSAAQAKGAQ